MRLSGWTLHSGFRCSGLSLWSVQCFYVCLKGSGTSIIKILRTCGNLRGISFSISELLGSHIAAFGVLNFLTQTGMCLRACNSLFLPVAQKPIGSFPKSWIQKWTLACCRVKLIAGTPKKGIPKIASNFGKPLFEEVYALSKVKVSGLCCIGPSHDSPYH